TSFFCFGLWVCSMYRRKVDWRWKVVNHRVEYALYTDVLESRTGHHWEDLVGNHGLAECCLEFVVARLVTIEICSHLRFVVFNDSLHEFTVVLLSFRSMFLWDFVFNHVHSHFSFEGVRLHLKKVDHALKLVFLAPWDLESYRLCRE